MNAVNLCLCDIFYVRKMVNHCIKMTEVSLKNNYVIANKTCGWKKRINNIQLVLCPTTLTFNNRNVPARMSCAQPVPAHCVRTTCNQTVHPTSWSITDLDKFLQGCSKRQSCGFPYFLYAIWVFFFCAFCFRCRASKDTSRRGTTRPQMLQCRWATSTLPENESYLF